MTNAKETAMMLVATFDCNAAANLLQRNIYADLTPEEKFVITLSSVQPKPDRNEENAFEMILTPREEEVNNTMLAAKRFQVQRNITQMSNIAGYYMSDNSPDIDKQYFILHLGVVKETSQAGEVERAVKDAIDAGYRHIDCAFIYQNEKEVGKALKEKMTTGKVSRENLFITSKLWCTYHTPAMVEEGVYTSLQDLGLEYLDLYLIHWPQAYQEGGDLFPKDESGKLQYSTADFRETWEAMENLVERGLVRSIGVSNFNRAQLDKLLAVAKIQPAVLQIEVHPYLNQQPLIEYAKSRGILVTAYSPLGSPDRPWAMPGEKQLMDDERLKVIAKKYKKSVAQVLIRYALDRSLVVIPKSVTKERIIQNLNVTDFKLTAEDLKQIMSLERHGRLCDMKDVDHPDYPFKEAEK